MKVLLLAIMLLPFCAIGQTSVNYDISNVVEIPNVKKDELYRRAIFWISDNFRSANNVIQLQDKENGQIIAKGSIEYGAKPFMPGTNYSGYFTFTLNFECKDNKYRYSITRMTHEASFVGYSVGLFNYPNRKGVTMTRKSQRKVIEQGSEYIISFSESFKRGISQSSRSQDW